MDRLGRCGGVAATRRPTLHSRHADAERSRCRQPWQTEGGAWRSLSEIARQAGLAKGTLSKLELGVGNPTIDTLYAIADVLEVSVSQLVSRRTSHVAVERAKDAHWTGSEGLEARPLSHVFGAGLIETYELRLSSTRREAEPHPPGTLEHVFVISGKALLGPLSAPETLSEGTRFASPAMSRMSTSPYAVARTCIW